MDEFYANGCFTFFWQKENLEEKKNVSYADILTSIKRLRRYYFLRARACSMVWKAKQDCSSTVRSSRFCVLGFVLWVRPTSKIKHRQSTIGYQIEKCLSRFGSSRFWVAGQLHFVRYRLR